MKSFRSVLALALICALVTLSVFTTACDPPKREQLVKVAGYGQQIAGVIAANESLPDQLFAEHVVTAEVRDMLVTHIQTARTLTASFNAGMTQVLASERPNFGPIIGVVAQMISEAQAIRGLIPNEAARKVLAGFELGLRAVATYFAVQLQQARVAGYSDAQIARALGVLQTDEARKHVALIEAYAAPSATHPAAAA